ncbi:hypothetical protein K0T92_05425 [Paenibacillus oenotherae]|uniref:Uncharacterized protein n=1 Tax=Paenibacillus oenotherae TaxID=1435645 RepID=A0ABS7D2Y7_9BACL|nr:hypothetical protein [Paenibacillus oenotherae]MBW7474176.1 hypothetical protein [Paenibacillus oenotherae]
MDAIKKNEDKVLNGKSLKNRAKAAYDKNKIKWTLNLVFKLLKKLVKVPVVNKFLDYHKTHIKYLGIVLTSVVNMEPIDKEIEDITINLDDYIRQTEEVLAAIAELPMDPLEGMRNPVIILEIAEDPAAAKEYDEMLDAYQELVQTALNAITHCAEQGRDIERDTRDHTKNIIDKLNGMTVESAIDRVLIERNKTRVQFVQLDLMTRIQRVRSRAEDAKRVVEPLIVDVALIGRINKK